MSTASLSIITPVIRWKTLKRMLDQLVPQLSIEDEVLIVGDGPQPECKKVVSDFRCPSLKYLEATETRKWGNHQRNVAISKAEGSHLVFIDDDDQVESWGVSVIRRVANEYPGRPIMFRMLHKGRVFGSSRLVKKGDVSGQMFVPPNQKDRLGVWGAPYYADFGFIKGTIDLYPDKENAIVWREEMPIIQGLHGA